MVTGKITSRYTYQEAFSEGILQEELQRCEEYLDRNFERLCTNPDGTILAEFEIDLPSEELKELIQ